MSLRLLLLSLTVTLSLGCFAADEAGVRIVTQTEDTAYVSINGGITDVARLNEWLHFHQHKVITAIAPLYSTGGVIGYVFSFKEGQGLNQAFESVPVVYRDLGCLVTIDKWRKYHPERKLDAFTTVIGEQRTVVAMIFCYSTTTELEKPVTTPNKN